MYIQVDASYCNIEDILYANNEETLEALIARVHYMCV